MKSVSCFVVYLFLFSENEKCFLFCCSFCLDFAVGFYSFKVLIV